MSYPLFVKGDHKPKPTERRPPEGEPERCTYCAAVIVKKGKGWRHD